MVLVIKGNCIRLGLVSILHDSCIFCLWKRKDTSLSFLTLKVLDVEK